MKMTSMTRLSALSTALLAGALLSGTAGAHQIWLEQNATSANIYFGEFGDNLREVSPGLLDKFTLKSIMWISASGSKPLQASKTAGAYVLNGKVAPGESIIVEENNYPMWEGKKDGKVTHNVWIPAARIVADHSAQTPTLTLDLVPTGTPGQFKVTYQGKPLAKAKVGAVIAAGWAREAYSDAQGLVSFALPWQGQYVLEVHHDDKSGGQRDGKAWDSASLVTTLSLVQPQGVAPLPASPALPPSKAPG
jgi:uncharacterized GH25 family protein